MVDEIIEHRVVVSITSDFYNPQNVSKALLYAEDNPIIVMKAWAKIERERGLIGNVRATTTVLPNTVEIAEHFVESRGFKALEMAKMILIDNSATASELDKTHFELFWKSYPFRAGDNGKPIKQGKASALREFKKHIRTKEDFSSLMLACKAYEQATKFRKDAERFLRGNFWKDYVGAPGEQPDAQVAEKSEEDREALFNKIKNTK